MNTTHALEKPQEATPVKRDAGRILIIEDERSIQRIVALTLAQGGYQGEAADSAEDARKLVTAGGRFGMILADIGLPGESGIDFLRWVKTAHPDTAVIMLTGEDDRETAEKALALGAYGYVIKPFTPKDLLIRISAGLKRQEEEARLRKEASRFQQQLTAQSDELRSISIQLNKAMKGIITAMALALESRDPYTAGHQQRVAELSMAIGMEMGLEEKQIHTLQMAAMVHDLGKISIPSEILSKPGILSDIEFSLMKTHAANGYNILREIDFPWPIADIVHQHHERPDGTGYPNGLKDRQILLESKIIAVADTVEAMVSHRPYRPALEIGVAIQEITQNRGRHYEAPAVDACIKLVRTGRLPFASK